MHIFIAADTYLHTPRNIFGFKKKMSPQETRPVTSVLSTSDGEIIHASQYKAKLKDDPKWSSAHIDAEFYGPAFRTSENLDDINLELQGFPDAEILVYDQDTYAAMRSAGHRIYGEDIFSLNDKRYRFVRHFLLDELFKIDHRDLAMLSGADYFASTINLRPSGQYVPWEVEELLWSYCDIRLPNKNRNSRGKIEDMVHNYNVVTTVIPEIIRRLKS